MDWYQIKVALSAAMAVSQDALHIFVGVGVQILLAALLRQRLSSLLPWLIVLALGLGNEWSDLHLEIWPDRAVQYGESLKDMVVTMMLPTVLLLLARHSPGLFSQPFGSATDDAMANGLETGPAPGAVDAG